MKPNVNLTKAISTLIQTQPFYACLVMFLEHAEDTTDKATMGTDGTRLFYNPSFVDALPAAELIGVLVHEVLHCALGHHVRRGSRDNDLWNVACDLAINPIILDAGFKLPPGHLREYSFVNLGAEEIYARLEAQGYARKAGDKSGLQPPSVGQNPTPASAPAQPSHGQGGHEGHGTSGQATQGAATLGKRGPIEPCPWGKVLDAAPSCEPALTAEHAVRWQRYVMTALAIAKASSAGSLPGDLQAVAQAVRKERIDWRAQLHRFINDVSRVEQDWCKPNKRLMNYGFVLPGNKPDGINKVGIVIDTSGSVADALCEEFLGEIMLAVDLGAIKEAIVIQCDTKVRNVIILDADDNFYTANKFKIQGRGDTKFSPALKWFLEFQPDVAALIYFTDLECSDYGPDPNIPVLWIGYGMQSDLDRLAKNVPFGEVIKIVPNK